MSLYKGSKGYAIKLQGHLTQEGKETLVRSTECTQCKTTLFEVIKKPFVAMKEVACITQTPGIVGSNLMEL